MITADAEIQSFIQEISDKRGTINFFDRFEKATTPAFILHGEKDIIFPEDYIEKIYHRLTCKKAFKSYKGLHHYILFDNVDVIHPDIVEWLEEICT